LKYQSVKGMKDILPGEVGRWQAVETLAREYFSRFGYKEIRSPILEKTELFIRGIGETTDVVEKEMYTFIDRSGDSLTMRPEATAQMCRAYVEHKLHSQTGGWKVFTIGPMFRHEQPQKGRFRQFHQIDVEVIGPEEGLVDAELISMLIGFLEECRVGPVSVRLNSLGCRNCRPAYREKLIEFLKGRQEELCPECRRRLELNPLRVLDCKSAGCKAVVADAPAAADHLCPTCQASFGQVRAGLEGLGLDYELDHRLVRGLDYYVGTTFEVISGKLGGQDAVCGGGRYDGLIAEVGGPDQGGTGFAIGLERLLLLSELDPVSDRPDLFLAHLGQEASFEAFKLGHQLRAAGLKVIFEPGEKSLKAQLRRAGKLEAGSVLILGPEELERRVAVLKDMEPDGEQRELGLDGLSDRVAEIIHGKKA